MNKQESVDETYKLGEKLGEGSYGKVYKAVHHKTKEEVALKYITKKGTKKKDIDAIIAENQILKKISHDNIIRLIDCFETPTDLIIVTDYAGTTLQEVFSKARKFSIEEIKNFSRQIFSAMWYLREKKIAHRDLKPQNILIKDGIIKLCDFGFAKQLSASTQFMNSIRGTPLYIAPQIITNQPYTDKVDIWSFGIIIYEFFSGRPPFLDTTMERVINKIIHQKIRYPPTMPNELKQILSGMLQKNQNNRFSWEQLKAYDFFQKPEPFNEAKLNVHKQEENKVEHIQKEDILKKKASEQQEEFDAEEIHKPLRNLVKDDPTFEYLRKLESDLVKFNKGDNSEVEALKKMKSNEQVFQKIISIMKSHLVNQGIVQKKDLETVINILNLFITKVKLTSPEEISNDITKKKQILFAVLKIAGETSDPLLLAKEFVLIGFLIKNNFDGQSVDFDTDEDIMDLCLKEIKEPTSKDCFNHALKIMGILANQAIVTINNSQEFFIKVQAGKIISVIAESYEPSEQKTLVLQCLEKFIHPSIPSKVENNHYLKSCFKKLKEQVAIVLINKNFLSQNPLSIYSGSQARQEYAKICYECMRSSDLFLKQFSKQQFWVQFVNHKPLRIYSLAFDHLCIQKEKSPLLSNEIVHEKFIQSAVSTKMENVFLISRAAFNLCKKQASKKKIEHTQSLLLQIYQLLSLEQDAKLKACRQVEGQLSFGERIFEDILGSAVCSILQDPNLDKSSIDDGIIISILKSLLYFKHPHQELRTSFFIAGRCMILREQFIRNQSQKMKNDKQLNTIIYNLYTYFITAEAFNQLKTENSVGFIRELISCFFVFMKLYGGTDEKGQLQLYKKAEDKGFHVLLFSDEIVDQKSLTFGFHMLLKLSANSEYFEETIDILGINLNKAKKYLMSDVKDQDFILNVLQVCSLLVRKNQNHKAEIKKFGIMVHLPEYLKSTNETMVHQALTLIGNLAKHSTFFFDDFAEFSVFNAMRVSFMNHGHGNKNKIIKGLVYAIGNISFYNDKFFKEIKPMVGMFETALNLKDSYLIQNTLSTVSNLLRHSDCYIESLVEHKIIKKVIQIVMNSKSDDNFMSFGLNLLKKAILYPKTFTYHKEEEFNQIYYEKRKIVNHNNQFMKIMKGRMVKKLQC